MEVNHCTEEKKKSSSILKRLFSKWRHNPKVLLIFLVLAGIVQGMIFTNVVISSLERRFGLDSTQSGMIAGAYDFGNLLAVVPVTYFGGHPDNSKPKYIASGMAIIALGSTIFVMPHFFTSSYTNQILSSTQIETGNDTIIEELCVGGQNEEWSGTNLHSLSNETRIPQSSPLAKMRFIFIGAQVLHGIGAAAITTLGVSYIDDCVDKTHAPLYIGIFESSFVFGPAIGYLLGGKFLEIYTEFYSISAGKLMEDFNPKSPQWVGAWWLGFILIVGLALLMAFFIALFPKKLNIKEEEEETKREDKEESEGVDELMHIDTCEYRNIKDMPRSICDLLKNTVYLFISIGAALDAFLLAGMAAFLPKYLESQLGLTAGRAAMTVGLIVVPAGVGGTLTGGYLMKRFKIDKTNAIKMYLLCQAVVIPFYIGFLYHCPTEPYQGLNHHSDTSLDRQIFADTCNTQCGCSILDHSHVAGRTAVFANSYSPVCSLRDHITYFSPCHAGCRYQNQSIFYGCSCTSDPDESGTAVRGPCQPTSESCRATPLAIIIFFQIFFKFMATMPGMVASIRSVKPMQKSLALGLQMMMMRGLGTVPGPVVFGAIIDQTCMLWAGILGSSTNEGSCRLYDNTLMSRNVMSISITWRAMAALSMAVAFYLSRKANRKPDVESPSKNAEQK